MIGNIMKEYKFKIMGILLLSCLMFGSASADVMTLLVYKELEGVNTNSKTVVLEGKPYKYKLDVKKTKYRFEADAKTSVGLSQLKVGEKYYFQLLAKDEDIARENYRYITFISKSAPSE